MSDFAEIIVASLLGAIIGLERELSGKPAGLRTHMFVAAGSALLVVLTPSTLDQLGKSVSGELTPDPIRVIQAIIVGISFLGAGTIVHNRGEEVEGLTTAASIYLTTGIGIAVAVGRVWLAIQVTVLAIIFLTVLSRVEYRWIDKISPSDTDSKAPQQSADDSNNQSS
ncbi:putative Mg(2+) transport ATPase [Thalassoglobus neptunius]|uniref:Putative Mg(2+) transport ATPase n=1 Tax=Thalassoglobus neptunius TaxID=1938619 RepID=A0A5C5WCU2_9PLAN|nr:MgtC/SapB family protein [Thalassoglobus neptunius]TWT47881.1 putative Mg(2+) transport ATPase [Thalassoglobus neptunius]